ncbi:MAG TPA: DUF488 domain-containing protein [Pyrinomonadaceae bacterium]
MRTMAAGEEKSQEIWTVGHSTRSLEDFKLILNSQGIQTLADVRAYPVSRRYPHFNKEVLKVSLNSVGIEYQQLPALGGRRSVSQNSRNIAWKNPSFRAYADYMETNEFKTGIKELMKLSTLCPTAVMCAEAVWWRCHRSLIADYLKAQGWIVTHILSAKKTELHPYTSAASIIDGELSYRGLLSKAG